MLRIEAALARACAAEELITREAAEAVARACATALDGSIELEQIAAAAGEHASPVIPLVAELRIRVGEEFAASVHVGATSQDIIDTAAMLVSRDALEIVLEDAHVAALAAGQLAERFGDTPVLGRTLLQPALPISFGRKASVWQQVIADAIGALEAVAESVLAVQMGGPVGTRPAGVGALVAEDLDLLDPGAPWHTNRVRVAQLGAQLGVLAGALSKVARDVTLLAQGEVAEVHEGGPPGRGGSSAMAHKHNPVAAVSVLACARRTPGLVATMLASMEQEHERAAGAWQAEWGTLSELLTLTGSAAAWAADMLTSLEVDPERMRHNLAELSGDEQR
jgi:3-carboxy-cis,cis-muconate cycloisomerase